MDAVKLGIYKHYKGNHYRLVGEAMHSETLERLIVYQCVKTRKIWVRPKDIFLEDVVTDQGTLPRFEYLGTEDNFLCEP